jgi:hypothetical protein
MQSAYDDFVVARETDKSGEMTDPSGCKDNIGCSAHGRPAEADL